VLAWRLSWLVRRRKDDSNGKNRGEREEESFVKEIGGGGRDREI